MNKIFPSVVLGIAAVVGTSVEVSGESIKAVVSILPQQEIVQEIGGSEVTVTVLIPPGKSPATFEPSPRLMAAVSDADLLLPLALPFERTVIARIHDLHPDLPVCRGLPIVEMETGASTAEAIHHDDLDHTGHDHREGPDPHFWLDPQQTIDYAHHVRRCLCDARPQACNAFTANTEIYTKKLAAADARISALLAPFSGRNLFVFHPAFGHFTHRYGLQQMAIEFEGKNPTGRHLATVIRDAEAQKVGVIFIQPQFAGSGAQAVAAAIDADLVELDPLAPDLLANLERIASIVARAFEVDRGSTK